MFSHITVKIRLSQKVALLRACLMKNMLFEVVTLLKDILVLFGGKRNIS